MSKSARLFGRPIALQLILVIPFVLQIFAAVSLVGYLSFRNGQKAVNNLALQLMTRATQQVDAHLDHYMALPQKINQLNAEAIAAGELSVTAPIAAEQYFWRQAKTFDTLSYVGYALPDGSESGAGRWLNGVDLVVYQTVKGMGSEYATGARGNRTQLLQSYEFNQLVQLDYIKAIQAGKPIWSSIANLEFSDIQVTQAGAAIARQDSQANIGYAAGYVVAPARQAVYGQSGNLQAVLLVDVLLSQISDFLRSVHINSAAQVFVMERDGQLIASSGTDPLIQRSEGEVKRLSALESPNPRTHAIAQALKTRFDRLAAIQVPENLEIRLHGDRQFVQVTPWRDAYGLDWLVVVTVPESAFMQQINANTRTTIFLCFAALVTATLLGIVTSRWITRPILALQQAAKAIATGQFDRRVGLSRIQELGAVGESFNRMADQLQTSISALEQSNFELEDRVSDRTQELRQKNAQLQQTLEELHRTQAQMVQSEKMSALGQMVAGVAHEINNPVNFIHGNLVYVDGYTHGLLKLVQAYQQHYPQPPSAIAAIAQEVELDFMTQDMPQLLESMKVGTQRIREIVVSLRNFSRLDESEYKAVNLHEGIENTLLILRHRLKAKSGLSEIQVIRQYGSLPPIECYPGQLNQVFMNLLSNAIDALEETSSIDNPTIWIETLLTLDQYVQISIADNAAGIPIEIQSRLFDPFFTTKPSGKGTGLGLSISHQIITKKHQGKLWCNSILGKGTKFTVEIPVRSLDLVDRLAKQQAVD